MQDDAYPTPVGADAPTRRRAKRSALAPFRTHTQALSGQSAAQVAALTDDFFQALNAVTRIVATLPYLLPTTHSES